MLKSTAFHFLKIIELLHKSILECVKSGWRIVITVSLLFQLFNGIEWFPLNCGIHMPLQEEYKSSNLKNWEELGLKKLSLHAYPYIWIVMINIIFAIGVVVVLLEDDLIFGNDLLFKKVDGIFNSSCYLWIDCFLLHYKIIIKN